MPETRGGVGAERPVLMVDTLEQPPREVQSRLAFVPVHHLTVLGDRSKARPRRTVAAHIQQRATIRSSQ